MFWADQIAQQIKNTRIEKKHHVDDMKTPSGKIHVGSLVGVLLHDFIYKSLQNLGVEATYTYVFNDMDPMDSLPGYLDSSVYQKYMGVPVYKIPAPDGTSSSFAFQFANEFIVSMQKLGAHPEIIWSHELYESGKMNGVIKEALDKAAEIRSVYKEIGGYDKKENWYPFQAICPKCGKLGTTEVDAWNGETVHFICKKDLVKWAEGCGYEGEVSPFDGKGKLMWKVDWPAHWKVIGVTVEGAGKDHSSAGGSRDMAKEILKRVYDYPDPFDIPYEWFLIKGKKMSSSKGVGTSASEFVKLFPAQIGRFLFARNRYNRQTNFDPEGMTIPDLFDEYDRCAEVYFTKGNSDDFGRIYEVAQVEKNGKWQNSHFVPRFLEVARIIQDPKVQITDYFTEKKGSSLTEFEKLILEERISYAQSWLESYAPEEMVLAIKKELPLEISLTESQKKLLLSIADFLKQHSEVAADELQNTIYTTGKNLNLKPKESFQAVYLSLLGKNAGPKAGVLILEQDRQFVIQRFEEISVT